MVLLSSNYRNILLFSLFSLTSCVVQNKVSNVSLSKIEPAQDPVVVIQNDSPNVKEESVVEKIVKKSKLILKKRNKRVQESEHLTETLKDHAFIPSIYDFGKEGTVKVLFGKTNDGKNSNQLVNRELILALGYALDKANKQLLEKDKIREIYISATTNGRHSSRSNHYKKRAVDISKINGVRIIQLGPNRQIIAFQNALDESPLASENFGPYLKHRTYDDAVGPKSIYVGGHRDHIHFSVRKKEIKPLIVRH